MKKIIVFGASGNVGSDFIDYALDYFKDKNYELIAVGHHTSNIFQKSNIPYITLDIAHREEFTKLPQNDVYAIVLLAALIPAHMIGYHPEMYINVNIIGAFNVLEYCRAVHADRIIYAQTVFDLGTYIDKNLILSAEMVPSYNYTGDHAMYVITKSTAVHMIEHYYQEYGLKRFIIRLPHIYKFSKTGYYYQDGVKKIRPLYKMILSAIKGEPLEVWGNPSYSKNMTHISDLCQIFCKAIEADIDGGIYNAGTGTPITIEEEIKTIIEVFSPKEKPSKIVYCPEKSNFGGFLMDISKTKKELGYEPKYTCKMIMEEFKREMKTHPLEL